MSAEGSFTRGVRSAVIAIHQDIAPFSEPGEHRDIIHRHLWLAGFSPFVCNAALEVHAQRRVAIYEGPGVLMVAGAPLPKSAYEGANDDDPPRAA